MRYGFIIPGGGVRDIVELGREAEAAGWDAVFYWDGDWGVSPWVTLGAIAAHTERIRLGAVLHPLPWRRPWLLARDIATLDQLSGGRAVLPIGLGAVHDPEWAAGSTRTGEVIDRKVRAQLMDEGLDVIDGLWSGEPFTYDGQFYHLRDATLDPTPVQRPRVPIWVVAAWPRMKSMRRVLRCDGILVSDEWTPDDLRAMRAFVEEHRGLDTPFDVVMEGSPRGGDPQETASAVRAWAERGVTWWLEAMWSEPNSTEDVRARIRQGPPRVKQSRDGDPV